MTRIKTTASLCAAMLALSACSGATQEDNAAADETVFLNEDGAVEDTNLTAAGGAPADDIAREPSNSDDLNPTLNAGDGNGT